MKVTRKCTEAAPVLAMNYRVARLLTSRGIARSILDPYAYGRSGSEPVKQREVSVLRSTNEASRADAQRQLQSWL